MFIKYFKNFVILGMFSLLFSVSTVLVYQFTRNTIYKQDEMKTVKLLKEIMSIKKVNITICKEPYLIKNDHLGDNLIHRFWLVKKNQKFFAFIVETTAPDGYSGSINMVLSADFYGNIIGVRIVSHHETPGLGDKIDMHISNWITIFSGINLLNSIQNNFAIKKDGGIINQFTGATITPRAVTNSIKRTVLFILHALSSHNLLDIKGNYVNYY